MFNLNHLFIIIDYYYVKMENHWKFFINSIRIFLKKLNEI